MAKAGSSSDSPNNGAKPKLRYVRKPTKQDFGSARSGNFFVTDPISANRPSLIPKFDDEEWELESTYSGADEKEDKKKVNGKNDEGADKGDEKHDGFTAYELKPVYGNAMWKYVGDPSVHAAQVEKAASEDGNSKNKEKPANTSEPQMKPPWANS